MLRTNRQLKPVEIKVSRMVSWDGENDVKENILDGQNVQTSFLVLTFLAGSHCLKVD